MASQGSRRKRRMVLAGIIGAVVGVILAAVVTAVGLPWMYLFLIAGAFFLAAYFFRKARLGREAVPGARKPPAT